MATQSPLKHILNGNEVEADFARATDLASPFMPADAKYSGSDGPSEASATDDIHAAEKLLKTAHFKITRSLAALGTVCLALLMLPACVSIEGGGVNYNPETKAWDVNASVKPKPKATGKEPVLSADWGDVLVSPEDPETLPTD